LLHSAITIDKQLGQEALATEEMQEKMSGQAEGAGLRIIFTVRISSE
jgi:hypothetical protein